MKTLRAIIGLAVCAPWVLGGCSKTEVVPIDQWIPVVLRDIQVGICSQKDTNFDYVPIGSTQILNGGTQNSVAGTYPIYPSNPQATTGAVFAGAAGGDSHVTLTAQTQLGWQAGIGPISTVAISGQLNGSDTRTVTIKVASRELMPLEGCQALLARVRAEKQQPQRRGRVQVFTVNKDNVLEAVSDEVRTPAPPASNRCKSGALYSIGSQDERAKAHATCAAPVAPQELCEYVGNQPLDDPESFELQGGKFYVAKYPGPDSYWGVKREDGQHPGCQAADCACR
jgi:hypothetical protein